MFDSIDLSSIDDMDSQDSMGTDDGFAFGSELPQTEDLPGTNDTFLRTETLTELEYYTQSPQISTDDSTSLGTDVTFPGSELNPKGWQEVSTKPIDTSGLESELTFKGGGYSQSEINSHISKAEHEIAYEESTIRHHTNIANSKARMGEPHSYEDYQIRLAQSRLNDAKSDLSKWQHMKPSK